MAIARRGRTAVTVTVGKNGTLIVPRELCMARDLHPGDAVEVELVRGGILVETALTDDEMAAFWGEDWQERLAEAEANIAAGRSTVQMSTDEFLAELRARMRADA